MWLYSIKFIEFSKKSLKSRAIVLYIYIVACAVGFDTNRGNMQFSKLNEIESKSCVRTSHVLNQYSCRGICNHSLLEVGGRVTELN